MKLFYQLLVFLILTCSLLPAQETKHLILINSYHQGMEWTDKITEEVLKKYAYPDSEYRVHVEYMDTKSIYSKEYLHELYKLYKRKYSNKDISLIFASDNHALDFLLQFRNDIFGKVPVVFCGINNYQDSMLEGHKNYTGIAEYFSIQATVKTILKLHPETQQLYVLNDYLKTGRETKKIIQQQIEAMGLDLYVNYSEELSIAELRRKVASMDKKTAILLGFFFADKHGVQVSEYVLKNVILKESIAPIYTLSEFYVGGGVIGGKVINARQQGKFISSLGIQILNGTNIQMLPVTTRGANNYIFDYNALQKYKVNMENLPPISTIKNKTPSFYEKYTSLVHTTLFFIVLLLFVIVFLAKKIQHRKKRERELEEKNKNLKDTIEDLKTTQSD